MFELFEMMYQAYPRAVPPPEPGVGGTNCMRREYWSRTMFFCWELRLVTLTEKAMEEDVALDGTANAGPTAVRHWFGPHAAIE